MLTELFELLTDDELSLVRAKMSSAIAATNILADHFAGIIDGMAEDWPDSERWPMITNRNLSSDEKRLASWYSNVLWDNNERYYAHYCLKKDLLDILSW